MRTYELHRGTCYKATGHFLNVLTKSLERLSLTFTANGKNKTFAVFSSLYSRTKIFVFAVNSKRHFLFLYDLFKDNMKRIEKTGVIFTVCCLP